MLLVTTDHIPNKSIIHTHGIVKAISIRNPAVKGGIKGIFKIFMTGSLNFYGQACLASREDAEKQLKENAELMGANAVIGIRYETSSYYEHLSEIIIYGTAVTFE
jgi:uncharacterized protein YbjQ (UPF0145 family)